jgi:hypothetical protein
MEVVTANVESLPHHWQARCMEIVAEEQMRDFKRLHREPGVVPSVRGGERF